MRFKDIYYILSKKDITGNETMINSINIEDTNLFNYKGGQSTVYNRFCDSNIKTLEDLFVAHQKNNINYGKNEMKTNRNYYIHNEINGIISLLKYKYLRIFPDDLKELLSYQIDFNFNIYISPYSNYGYPGSVYKSLNEYTLKYIEERIMSFYKTVKSCGFDQTAAKALIDIAYEERLTNITLGEFLSTLSIDKITKSLRKVPDEIQPFINILKIINDFQEEYSLLNNQKKSIR